MKKEQITMVTLNNRLNNMEKTLETIICLVKLNNGNMSNENNILHDVKPIIIDVGNKVSEEQHKIEMAQMIKEQENKKPNKLIVIK